MYYNTLVKVVSMDVEAIAVIKKNSKNRENKYVLLANKLPEIKKYYFKN